MKLRYVGVGAAFAGLLLTGCQTGDEASSSSSSTPSSTTSGSVASPTPSTTAPKAAVTPSSSATVAAVKCKARLAGGDNWLPDKKCTPGLVNRSVTQSNIKSTICKSGWAEQQRKTVPDSYYAQGKARSLREYGYYAGRDIRTYEYDHLVPISVGGAVTDLRNLWVEHDDTPNPKDAVEAKVKAAVCDGRMTLAAARQGFQKDWTKIVVPPKRKASTTTHRSQPPASKTVSKSVYYANCAAARAAGVAPLYAGEPGYRLGLDRDHDGKACE